MKYPSHLISLIEFFKKLPGVGQKSAERFAFSALDWPREQLEAFGKALIKTPNEIHYCSTCGAMAKDKSCFYCDDDKRSQDLICVVAFPKDVFSIEDSHFYNGLYHVLGGLLSPSSGFNHDEINLTPLKNRLKTLPASEVILAFDSTVEGDATTLLLKKELSANSSKISRLAFGMPVGSSLEYIDSCTLSRAFAGRLGF
jgi:recombination protein RecR